MENGSMISDEQYQGDDQINRQDQIFERICTKQELDQQAFLDEERCYISNCKKKFGYMNKHQCKFCGHLVCEKHGFKHRPNPQDPNMFKRICVICENKYLHMLLNQPYEDEKNKEQDKINKLELIINLKQNDKKEKSNLVESQKRDQQNSSSRNNTKLKEEKQRQITYNQENIDDLKKELEEINKKTLDLEQQNQQIKQEIQEKKQQQQDEKLKAIKIKQAVEATKLDTEATRKAVKKIDEKIQRNNFHIEERETIKKQREKQIQNQLGHSPPYKPSKNNNNKNNSSNMKNFNNNNDQNLQGFKDSMIDDSMSLQSSIYYKEPEIYEAENGAKKNKKNKKNKKSKNKERDGNCGIDKCQIF